MSEEIQKLVPSIPDEWIFFKDIDFEDTSILQYHIDTRDFHCITDNIPSNKFNPFTALDKHPERYLYTAQELHNLISEYYDKSGGNRSWRILETKQSSKYTSGWQLKYIRIFRLNGGLIVCNKDYHAIQKEILLSGVKSIKEQYG